MLDIVFIKLNEWRFSHVAVCSSSGILIALSFAIWGIYSFDPESSQYNATAAMLKSIGDASMGMMVPILSAYIAEGLRNDLVWLWALSVV